MELNKKNVRTIIGIIIFTVLFIGVVNHFDVARDIFSMAIKLVVPFIVGACMAFIVNVPMSFFEEKVFNKLFDKVGSLNKGKLKKVTDILKKASRILGLIITLVLFALLIFFVGFLLVPEIKNTAMTIWGKVPGAANKVIEWMQKTGIDNEEITKWLSSIDINDWKEYLENAVGFLKVGVKGVFFSAVGLVSGTVGVIVDAFVAIVFAIYILFQKEKLSCQGKQILYAFLDEVVADKTVYILRLSYKTFRNFLTGQCIESVILGVMFFIAMLIFRMPYALLISVLIGITSLIPIFGAFVGCIIGVVLIIFVNPLQALWFVVLFLVLQQIEGNLIYPHVVGNSVGLPSIWVLVAVSLGGSLFGVVGMLVFIPITSVAYVLLREAVKGKLVKKELPDSKWKN